MYSWFGRQISTNLQDKPITFLVWKFKSIILIFRLFCAEFVKSTAFYKLLLLFQRVDMFELRFDAKITIQTCQLFGFFWNLPSKSTIHSVKCKCPNSYSVHLWWIIIVICYPKTIQVFMVPLLHVGKACLCLVPTIHVYSVADSEFFLDF